VKIFGNDVRSVASNNNLLKSLYILFVEFNKRNEGRNLQSVERKVNYEEVVVTEVTQEGSFFVQSMSEGPKAESLNAKLRQEFQANPPLPGAYTPKRGDVCAAKYTVDDEWYRVKVEKVQGGKATVHYIDYGNRETLPTTRLASLPAAYAGDKPYATEYVLPYVALPKDEEYSAMALKYLREDTAVSKVLMNVEYRVQGSPPAASLHVDSTPEGDIVKNLITEGFLLVENRKERRQNKLLAAYKEAQEVAKRNHSNIWEYGDITEDDAKEFGLGK
jgi:staphylococcal nuclease domain-containing protein 1